MDLRMVFLLYIIIERTTSPLRLWNQHTYPLTAQVAPSASKPLCCSRLPSSKNQRIERKMSSRCSVCSAWLAVRRQAGVSSQHMRAKQAPKNTDGTFLTWLLFTPWCFWYFLFSCSTLNGFPISTKRNSRALVGHLPQLGKCWLATDDMCLWSCGPQSKLYQNRTRKTGTLQISNPGRPQQRIVSWKDWWTVTSMSFLRDGHVLWSLNLF